MPLGVRPPLPPISLFQGIDGIEPSSAGVHRHGDVAVESAVAVGGGIEVEPRPPAAVIERDPGGQFRCRQHVAKLRRAQVRKARPQQDFRTRGDNRRQVGPSRRRQAIGQSEDVVFPIPSRVAEAVGGGRSGAGREVRRRIPVCSRSRRSVVALSNNAAKSDDVVTVSRPPSMPTVLFKTSGCCSKAGRHRKSR